MSDRITFELLRSLSLWYCWSVMYFQEGYTLHDHHFSDLFLTAFQSWLSTILGAILTSNFNQIGNFYWDLHWTHVRTCCSHSLTTAGSSDSILFLTDWFLSYGIDVTAKAQQKSGLGLVSDYSSSSDCKEVLNRIRLVTKRNTQSKLTTTSTARPRPSSPLQNL